MLFKNITIIDEKIQVRENMYVGVEGDTIDYIGETEPEKDYGEQYDGKGKLLMAGFVNAHAHSPMTLLRGYGENMALQDWLNKKIFPFEARLIGEDAYWGTLLAMAESIRYGIVSTTDMYYMTENMVNAVVESGAKANISRAITNMTGRDLFTMEEFYEEKNAVDMFDGAGDGRVKIDASLHAEYTSDPDTAMKLAQYAKQAG
ncbi:MAG: amidohydrolase family protein, partial [Bacillota bacterium]|nr:amidohydrolase family protein [Bacillota bacterium]